MEFWINSLNAVLDTHQQLTSWLEMYSPSLQVKLILDNRNLQKEGTTCKLAKIHTLKGLRICILSNFLNLRDPQSQRGSLLMPRVPRALPGHSVVRWPGIGTKTLVFFFFSFSKLRWAEKHLSQIQLFVFKGIGRKEKINKKNKRFGQH